MAIDFMPLGQAAAEVNRVLTSDGTVLINFHHPDLYPMGVRKLADIKKRISRSTVHIMRREKLARLFDIGSEKAPKKRPREEKTQRLRDKLDVLKLEFVDINFVVFYFPHIVFQSVEHIENFITTEFPNTFFQVSEQKNPRLENSWYQAEIRRENTKL